MTSIAKPLIPLAPLPKNELGLTIRDYEGAISTLCAGCGHDSVTAAITHAYWELSMPPHTIAKLSGIGCSSKTPTYFVRGAHGFNSAHGRMVTIATGANAANRDLSYIGISGDVIRHRDVTRGRWVRRACGAYRRDCHEGPDQSHCTDCHRLASA